MPTASEVGKEMSVEVTHIDQTGNVEIIESSPSDIVALPTLNWDDFQYRNPVFLDAVDSEGRRLIDLEIINPLFPDDGWVSLTLNPEQQGMGFDADYAYHQVILHMPYRFGGDINDIKPHQGTKIINDIDGEFTGFSVTNIGDLDGDGLSEVIIGSRQADVSSLEGAGKINVIMGDSLNTLADIILSLIHI